MDNQKSLPDLDLYLKIIIFAGLVLDTVSVYGLWKHLSIEELNSLLVKNDVSSLEPGVASILLTLQKVITVALSVFLIFDFFAFYFLYHYKNWARRYVISIAIFYLIGCVFDFSIIYLVYGLFTSFVLIKSKNEFLKS